MKKKTINKIAEIDLIKPNQLKKMITQGIVNANKEVVPEGLTIANISMQSTKKSLNQMTKLCENILKSKHIKNYLEFDKKENIINNKGMFG